MDKLIKNISLFGDSILKGIQINPINNKYYVNNQIDLETLGNKYKVQFQNYSSFGCTVSKGSKLLDKRFEKNLSCDAIVMDFGGNDCDYNWNEISQNPLGQHSPNTPIKVFEEIYCDIIDRLKKKGIIPILTTLPPLEPQKFFEWFCKDLNKENILMWLGEINSIYTHQENYSKMVEKIARIKKVPLIDLRTAFIKSGNVKELLCEDGTHPNTLGQKVISTTFNDFASLSLFSFN